MCGRFKLATDGDTVAREMDLPESPAIEPRYNIAPTQPVLAVRPAPGGGRSACTLRWGLIPAWSRDAKGAARAINARWESVLERPTFRDSARRRRCLVVADGFYEWVKGPGNRRRPFLIALRTGLPFAFAGLWDRWEGPDGPVESCTILTTGANALVAPLHDRMPVLLRREDHARWLDPAVPAESLAPLYEPWPADAMVAVPVAPHVNSPFVDDPRCIEPWSGEGELL